MTEMKSLTLNDKTYDCFVDSVARSQVEATMVVDSASGETIALSNASNYKLLGLHIYGKTTQDGTPTPENPVELVSVGDSGSVTVKVTGKNLFDYAPIDSVVSNGSIIGFLDNGVIAQGKDGQKDGGNGFENGWFSTQTKAQVYLRKGEKVSVSCDYTMLEYAYGTIVSKIGIYLYGADNLAEVAAWGLPVGEKRRISFGYTIRKDGEYYPVITLNSGKVRIENIQIECGETATPYEPYKGQSLTVSTRNTLGSVRDVAKDEIDFAKGERIERTAVIESYSGEVINSAYVSTTGELSEGATVRYVLDTPVVTPLSEAELAAYAALHTYRGNTTVSNDAGAHMELEYVMDAKKYIDSQISAGILAATVE